MDKIACAYAFVFITNLFIYSEIILLLEESPLERVMEYDLVELFF